MGTVEPGGIQAASGGMAVVAGVAAAPGNVIQVFPFTASEDFGACEPIVVFEFKGQPMVGYAECYRVVG